MRGRPSNPHKRPEEPEDVALVLGFASWPDGSFELIVADKRTGKETTLEGKLKPGQFDVIADILPSCVYTKAEAVKR